MRLIRFGAALAAAAFLPSILTTDLLAQNDPAEVRSEQSYEVMLQIVSETEDKQGRKDLPENLSVIQKQVKSVFGISNLRLMSAHIGRTSSAGTIEYKGILTSSCPAAENTHPSFLEWSVRNLRVNANEAASAAISIDSFRFSARVPVTTVMAESESGKQFAPVSYEAMGLSLARVRLSINQPTLIGTLDVPGLNGMTFLILTVRPV